MEATLWQTSLLPKPTPLMTFPSYQNLHWWVAFAWRNLHMYIYIYIYMYGWWFEPSWNMWVHPWEGCHPIYEMETSSIHVPNHHPDICMYIYVYIYIICMHISDFPFKILDLISKWTISPKKKMGKLSPWIYPSGASGGRLVFSDLMEFCCR